MWRALLYVACLATGVAASGDAYASDRTAKQQFDIPKLSVDLALHEFARQTKTPLLFPYDQASVVDANVLHGRYTPADGLKLLLAGTNLRGEITEDGVITVSVAVDAAVNGKKAMGKKSFLSKLAAGVSSLASAAVTGNAAMAQDAVTTRDDEIIVTARFREVGVQDIGASVKAFDEDDLNKLGISTTADLARAVPGLNIQERGPNRNEFNIRGVTNFLITQDLIPSARPVGVYLDDAPVNTLGGAQIDVRTFDLQRVEVLRGPQGTLFGEGASAGAVRYFTTNPDLSEVGGKFEIDSVISDEGGITVGARGAVNIPLVEDRLGVRITGGRYTSPGYIDVVGGDKDVNEFESTDFRGVLLARPSDNLTIRVMGEYEQSELGSLGLATGNPSDYSTVFPVDDDSIKDNHYLVTGKISYDFGAVTLESITSYFDHYRKRFSFDPINSAATSIYTIGYFGVPDETFGQDATAYQQFSQEVRLISDLDGPLQFTAGMFYRDFKFTAGEGNFISDSYLLFGLPSNETGVNSDMLSLPNPLIALSNSGQQYSGFVEAELSLSDRLRLIAGVRSHNEKIEASSPEQTLYIPTPLVAGAFSSDLKINTFLPTGAVEFDLSDDILLYARYATGARNGNLNSPYTLAVLEVFAPGASVGYEGYGEDRTRTIEGGFKSSLFDDRLTLNLTGYYTQYKDLQVIVSTPPLGLGLVVNASKAKSIGFEFEGDAKISDRLSTFFGISYTNAELASDLVVNQISGATLSKGSSLPNSPDVTALVGGEYVAPLFSDRNIDFYVNGSFSYTSEYGTELDASGITLLGDFGVGNLGAGIRGEDWSLDFFVSNITNNSETVSINNNDAALDANLALLSATRPAGVSFNEMFLLPPRTLRVTLRKQF